MALPGPQMPSWNVPHTVPWALWFLCVPCPWYFVQLTQTYKEVIKLKLRYGSVQYNQHVLGTCCILGSIVVNAEDAD